MGGGDLNLKKSWHPHTMKNQEKVWKAEQAKTQEENKLNDLRREIEEEKNRDELKRIGRESGVLGGSSDGDKKLDWMYKSSTELINREEYLLGRKIDKSFEVLQAEEKEKEQNLVGVKQPLNHVEHECVPFSIRAYKNHQNSEQVDLQRKVMEDPLMLIKQREMESRRKILENPVKLKELHRILKTDEKLRKVSKKSKKHKKSKKLHKNRSVSSSSSNKSNSNSNSDSDLDSKLAKKLKGGLLDKDDALSMGLNLNKLLDSKFEKISQELDKAVGRGKKRSKKNRSKSDYYTNESSDEEKNHKQTRPKFSHKAQRSRSVSRDRGKRYNTHEYRRSRSPTTRYSNIKHDYRSTSTSRVKNNFNSIPKSSNSHDRRRSRSLSRNRDRNTSKRSGYRSRSIDRNKRNRRQSRSPSNTRYRRSRSTSRDRKDSSISKSSSASRTKSSSALSRTQSSKNLENSTTTAPRYSKLTEDEKQAKLSEMMSNAAWREEERTEVVCKHREAYKIEEERHKMQDFDKNFLNKEVKKAMENQTSVGSRLRANLNNIQRTSAAMNSNFARK